MKAELDDIVFTPRERQVSIHLMDGHSNKEIGAILGIEEQTVKAHIHNILQKLDVKSRGAAVAVLIRHRKRDYKDWQ